MAKSRNIEEVQSDQEEGSDAHSINDSAAEHATRPAKRRRVSVSSNDSNVSNDSDDSDDSNTENYTPITPLPTISRIKKKIDVSSVSNVPSTEEPVSSRDARDIGLQVTDSTFATLNVAPWLVKSLSTMAIRRPTAIQKSCIPEILQGKDCIGGSRTGSGKTIAFAVPILQKWAEDPFGIYAVVLTPTR
jgi:ATP-dependent RNA helicase DDX49/DBP8